jgi:SAM-dependent methyltransferase|tara:strand:- start:378 stop:1004 length:627 start_codon:yes stop_codon:yes gene_type:complete
MSWDNWLNGKRFTLFRTAILQEQFIQCILDHTPDYGSILEAGFGFGTTIELLRDLGYSVQGFDLENVAVENCQKLYPLLENKLYVGDILSKDSYIKDVDTIIHQGVLEHFDDNEIKKILNIQCSRSKRVVFDVPNNLRRNLEDEGDKTRFESPEFWEDIISSVGLSFKRYGRTYDYGNDYLPQVLKRYDSDLMKKVGRSSIFVVEGKK